MNMADSESEKEGILVSIENLRSVFYDSYLDKHDEELLGVSQLAEEAAINATPGTLREKWDFHRQLARQNSEAFASDSDARLAAPNFLSR
jgi:hypothetical protein